MTISSVRSAPTVVLAGFLVCGCGLFLRPTEAQEGGGATRVRTLASFRHGTFLENLTTSANGSIIISALSEKELLRLEDDGPITAFATLSIHPAGIACLAGGRFVVVGNETAFTQDFMHTNFVNTNRILVLDGLGGITNTIAASDARFLNGAVALGADRVLIADAVAGVIWAFQPSTGSLTQWFKHADLAIDEKARQFKLGVNGVRIHDGFLYFSNSSREAIFRVKIAATGEPIGSPEIVARQLGPIDDFVVDDDGTVYGAMPGDKMLKVRPDGNVGWIKGDVCAGCTSILIRNAGAGRELIVLSTGDYYTTGSVTPARVLAVSLAQ